MVQRVEMLVGALEQLVVMAAAHQVEVDYAR
jgi:hypothetical protein